MSAGRQEEAGAAAGHAVRPNWWVLAAVAIGGFMSALDASVVNTVLPVLAHAFGAGVDAIEWVVTVYLLVVSGLLLSMGRLGDIGGHRRVFLLGFVIFGVGSGLCGLAPAEWCLVAARGVQAVGAAMLFAGGPALLTRSFPARMRGQALGLLAGAVYLGLSAGPSLGGWIAVHLGWRWVFYVNVPVGVAAIMVTMRFVPPERVEGRREPFDLGGAALFLLGLVALLLALNQGHAWGWGSAEVVGLFALGGALLVGFVALELRARHPVMDLRLFRSATFSAASASALLNYVAGYCIVFLLPFYLMRGRGLPPDRAGLVLSAQPLVMAVAAPLSGRLSDRIGTRIPATIGMVVLAGGLAMLSRIGAGTPMGQVAAWLGVAGLGAGLFSSPNNSAIMGAAPRERQGIAAGVLATVRNVGMVLGVGMAGAILTSGLAGASPGEGTALFDAVRTSLLAAAGVALVGAATSAIRESGPLQG